MSKEYLRLFAAVRQHLMLGSAALLLAVFTFFTAITPAHADEGSSCEEYCDPEETFEGYEEPCSFWFCEFKDRNTVRCVYQCQPN